MPERPFAEYAARNSEPILSVLRREFAGAVRALEIGSGTGQHAAAFATELQPLLWQTSDLEENHVGIQAWVQWANLPTLLPPLRLDVRSAELAPKSYDAVFSANTAHIMSWSAVCRMLELIGLALTDGGVFCLYGPFRVGGEFNTASNAAFDQSLRARSPEMGIRDLEEIDDVAAQHGMRRQRLYAMPANNNVAVWERQKR